HTISSMYRSGSRLFALDLSLGAVLVTVIVVQVRHLGIAGAGHVLLTTAALPFDLAVAAAALLAAAAAQLAYGRADARRGHVAPDPGRLPPGAEARRAALAVARLGHGRPVVEARALEAPDAELALALDGDGRQVVVSGRSGVSLVDLASGRLVAEAPLSNIWAADFLPGGAAVRFYQTPKDGSGHAFVVLDWTPKDGKRVERARVPVDPRVFLLARRGDLAVV